MLLLFSLIGSVYSSIPDIPIDGEFDAIPDDQLYETDSFEISYTSIPTEHSTIQLSCSIKVLINCMVYWISL